MSPPFSIYGSERSLPPRLRLSPKELSRVMNPEGQRPLSLRARMKLIEEDQRRRQSESMTR